MLIKYKEVNLDIYGAKKDKYGKLKPRTTIDSSDIDRLLP